MVVLIAAISFVGYFAIKIGGARRGAVFTGLAASTAVTLHLSRLSHRDMALAPMLAMGILLACGTMIPRMVLVATVVNSGLFKLLLVPTVVMALLVYLPALLSWRAQSHKKTDTGFAVKEPGRTENSLKFRVSK